VSAPPPMSAKVTNRPAMGRLICMTRPYEHPDAGARRAAHTAVVTSL
jgi:hypothetical protein